MQATGREDVAMSLVDQVRKLEQQVVDRLKELEPLTREYEQLRKVAERLGLGYGPGSPETDGEAKPSTATGRGGTRARAQAAGTRAKRQAAPSRAGATKPAAKPRSTRSTTRRRAGAAEATGASTTAASARGPKRTGAGGQPPRGRRRAAATGQRQDDVLRLVGENPGITVREIGERLGVEATGLYRVVKRLTDEGRLRKDGRRLHPVDSATASSREPEAAGGSGSQGPAGAAAETPEATVSAESQSSTAADAASST
jgi:hypothetical protein